MNCLNKELSIVVLNGGMSLEREVSLMSGKLITESLKRLCYNVVSIDVDSNVDNNLRNASPNVVYNALHGKYGEDGSIAGLLDVMQIPYTHSGVLASSIAMNKVVTKYVLDKLKIDYPVYKVITLDMLLSNSNILPYPYVIKPISEGSSIGVYVIFNNDDYHSAVSNIGDLGKEIIVEEYIDGQEIQTAIFLDRAVGTMEFLFDGVIYEYNAKYTKNMCDHIFPANVPIDVYNKTLEQSLRLYRCLGCKTMARIDFRYDPKKKLLKLLEINTHPGMTEYSAFPDIITRKCGISYDELVDLVVKDVLYPNNNYGRYIDQLMKVNSY
ncbi:D-alanine--D-alanine ligase [Candidatus Neoehrlichia procyonis]|uniref:D-alanine--D-alanine ligase n=1 Tax=Candidatus Neoehrlichia procyonis str. RAC413 TaxID=1359163 RepID=A0A0F3NN71_9RICK|nr:D-alanine--D-alanine ligase [Candidatus Neoehrlichia lotoris]KJV69127.1 D-alanine--D-alanine ligase family protein [Candidatus Neoehrlichia lotoris str. RAC413]